MLKRGGFIAFETLTKSLYPQSPCFGHLKFVQNRLTPLSNIGLLNAPLIPLFTWVPPKFNLKRVKKRRKICDGPVTAKRSILTSLPAGSCRKGAPAVFWALNPLFELLHYNITCEY